jgi:uncharacterized protein YjeT (DUF2065 family)
MGETLLMALALVMILEGGGPLLFPNRWIRFMRKLSTMAPEGLRQIGVVLVSAGLILFWLVVRQST